jgi:signal transduction histidine kinase
MIRKWLNWRTGLAVIAVVIVIATIFYSRYLANKIAAEERQKVEEWAEAQKYIASASQEDEILFATLVMAGQTSIPVIETNENDSITNYHNLDSATVLQDKKYLEKKLNEFKSANPPILTYFGADANRFNKYYYGESKLLKQVRYYPIVQLFVVALFIIITLVALNVQHKSAQNQLWAGMAKETAHQLGTPVSALEGWVEMLKETNTDEKMIGEIRKDVSRLKLVSDRFSKIGSTPHLEQTDLVQTIQNVVEYVRKRAPDKVQFFVKDSQDKSYLVNISPPLIEWVIENILKNALDAMEGKGAISISVHGHHSQVLVDIADTGKGISPANINKVFNPGFTTKKRGWGLGLTLSRRIVEQYHKGELYVKSSEPGRGTTFRIVLKK